MLVAKNLQSNKMKNRLTFYRNILVISLVSSILVFSFKDLLFELIFLRKLSGYFFWMSLGLFLGFQVRGHAAERK